MVLVNKISFYQLSATASGVRIGEDVRRKYLSLVHYGAENVYLVSSVKQVYSSGKRLENGVEWSSVGFDAQGGLWLKTAVNAVTVEVEEVLTVAD